MIYSDLYTSQKGKIPTLLGVFIIIFIFSFFFNIMNRSAMPLKASSATVKRTEVVNLNPIQASIYWQTQDKEIGWIIYGKDKQALNNIALDDRDISDKKTSFLNHYATLRNLKSDTIYYYAIISSNKKIIRPDGEYFSFKTPQSASILTKLNPANGKVLQANLQPLVNAIVLLTVNEETIPVSTITKDSGEWLIPLNLFYNKNSLSEQTFSGQEHVKVEILSEDGQITTIINSLEGLTNSSETTIIGKSYNFLLDNNVLSATSEKLDNTEDQTIRIIYPQEGALIPGRKPLIKGLALPLNKVSILIESKKTFSANITADKSGVWNYLIPENLDLGVHKITIKTKDINGKDTTLVRNFTIVANEGLEGKVLGTASGEPTITVKPSPTPTVYIYSTPTTVLSPTASPPVSGGINFFPIISGISLIIVGGGILLAF